jgi:hypothetical protein
MMKKSFGLLALSLVCLVACKQKNKASFGSKNISDVITQMTEIMVHDVTNPPLAARFFSYACLAGYEIVSENDRKFKSMYGVLNDYPQLQKPDSIHNYSYRLVVASILFLFAHY